MEASAADLGHMLWISPDRIITVAQGKNSSDSVLLVGSIDHEEEEVVFG